MSEQKEGQRPRVRWNWRVAAIVAVLFATIAAAVVTTDLLAVRDRKPWPETKPTGTRPIASTTSQPATIAR